MDANDKLTEKMIGEWFSAREDKRDKLEKDIEELKAEKDHAYALYDETKTYLRKKAPEFLGDDESEYDNAVDCVEALLTAYNKLKKDNKILKNKLIRIVNDINTLSNNKY
jgi:hypothetical protein